MRFNPIALKKAKIVYNFGLSECNRVNSKTRRNIFDEIDWARRNIVKFFQCGTS